MDLYTVGEKSVRYEILNNSLSILKDLKQKHPKELMIKTFQSALICSYIGIDLEEDLLKHTWPSNAIVQIMPYLFHISPDKSPITYVSPQSKKQFETIAKTIFEIWDCGKEVDVEDYILAVEGCMKKSSSST